MARRASSSRGRSSGSRGFSGTRMSSGRSFSGRSFSGGFKTSSTRHYGSHYTRHRPYRRNYFFHRLGPMGKFIYILVLLFLYIILSTI